MQYLTSFWPIYRVEMGSNEVKSEFSPDFNEIRTRGVFLPLKKGKGVRFAVHAVFDPILADIQGKNGVK